MLQFQYQMCYTRNCLANTKNAKQLNKTGQIKEEAIKKENKPETREQEKERGKTTTKRNRGE